MTGRLAYLLDEVVQPADIDFRVRQGQPVEGDELRHEGLGGGDAYLRAGPRVESAVGQAAGRAADDVGDGGHPAALRLERPDGPEHVGRLAGLCHDDGPAPGRGLAAVVELVGQLDPHRHIDQPLDDIFTHQAGMVGCAAGQDEHVFDAAAVIGQLHRRLPRRDVLAERVPDHLGLLVDLLEHEVLVAGLLGVLDAPGYAVLFPCDDGAMMFDLNIGGGDGGDVLILQVNDATGVVEQGRHVRGDEGLPVADAYYERAILACGYQRRLPGHDDDHGVRADDVLDGPRHGRLEIAVEVLFNQVGQHLGVRLRD